MVEKLANKVADWVIENNPDSQDKYEIYIYAVECICGFVFSNGIVLAISIFINLPIQAVIWLVFYNSLRFYIGGSHAKNFGTCLAGGTFFSMICIIASEYLIESIVFLFIEVICSIMITYFIAPVMHPNRSLSRTQIEKRHWIGKVIVIVESLAIFLIYNILDIKLAQAAALGMFAAAVLCLIGKFTLPSYTPKR